MLYRKIGRYIEQHLSSDSDKNLLIEGACHIGKITYMPIYYIMFIDKETMGMEEVPF